MLIKILKMMLLKMFPVILKHACDLMSAVQYDLKNVNNVYKGKAEDSTPKS